MRKLTLIMPLVLLTMTAAECGTNRTNSERPVHCEVLVDGPKKAEDREVIVGNVRFNCDKPGADPLVLKIRLDKKDGDQWHTATNKTFTVRGLDTNAGAFEHQSRTIELKCGSGVFRTVVDWSRASRGVSDSDTETSGVVKDPCRGILR